MSNDKRPPIQPPEVYTDQSKMPWGKHKGKALANIPAHYFLWLFKEGCDHPGIKRYIAENLTALEKEAGQATRRR